MLRSGKDLRVAYTLAIVTLLVGIAGYALTAVYARTPEQPVRIMYPSAAGRVLFDHKTHVSGAGYGFSCFDCHHHPPEDESAMRACGDCHNLPTEPGTYPDACYECHEEDEFEGSEVPKRGDAFHVQCVDCHKNAGAGPEDCNSCHVL